MIPFAMGASNPVGMPLWSLPVLALGALILVLVILALIGIARARHLQGLTQALWVLIVLAFPVVGAILWFVIGRRSDDSSRERANDPIHQAR